MKQKIDKIIKEFHEAKKIKHRSFTLDNSRSFTLANSRSFTLANSKSFTLDNSKSFTLDNSKSFTLTKSQEKPIYKIPEPKKMATVKIKLDFKVRKLSPHSVHIYVEDYGRGENGEMQLSPEIVEEKELDNYIDFLISELLQVRNEGRRKFRQAKN